MSRGSRLLGSPWAEMTIHAKRVKPSPRSATGVDAPTTSRARRQYGFLASGDETKDTHTPPGCLGCHGSSQNDLPYGTLGKPECCEVRERHPGRGSCSWIGKGRFRHNATLKRIMSIFRDERQTRRTTSSPLSSSHAHVVVWAERSIAYSGG